MHELLLYYIAITATFIIIAISLYYFIKRNLLNLEERNRSLITAREINKIILEELDFNIVVQRIVDIIPNSLQFGTGVLAILDEERGILRRIAASRTKEAEEAIKALRVPFNRIEISVQDPHNLMAKAIREKKPFTTEDVYDVLGPILTREEAADIQRIMSVRTTLVYPIFMQAKPIGVFLASTNKRNDELTVYQREIIDSFVEGAGIALQHSLLYRRIQEQSDQLRVANERLKELDHMKDEFVSLASHELRTPMTAIKSYLAMLRDNHMVTDAKGNDYVEHAYQVTDRLIDLVNDMLNVSRIESGRMVMALAPVDLLELIRDVIAEVTPVAEKQNITLKVTGSESAYVQADGNKIREVLMNLVGNSLKFTPAGGTITVLVQQEQGIVIVSVTDTGKGITRGDMPKLFTKFGMIEGNYDPASQVKGTGLGLYISKSIVELHGGKISASSPGENQGATFTFTLKKADSTQQPA